MFRVLSGTLVIAVLLELVGGLLFLPHTVHAITCGAGTDIGGGQCRVIITSGTSWSVPDDWNDSNNSVEVIGGGGGGATPPNGNNSNGNYGGAGGGGGGYSKIVNLDLTPAGSIVIQVGSGGPAGLSGTAGGDTFFNRTSGSSGTCASDTTSVCAAGGGGASDNFVESIFGFGGSASTGIGTTKTSGGNGGGSGLYTSGHDSGPGGGGGGGAGGPTSDGTVGGTGTDSAATAPGGNGGTGGAGGSPSGGSSGSSGSGGPSQGGVGGTNGGTGGNGTTWTTAGPGGGGGGGGGNAHNSTDAAGDGGIGGNYGAGGGGGGGGGRGSAPATTSGTGGAGIQGVIIITYTPGGGSALSKPPNNLGLLGYWSFNEGAGTVATDFSGNGRHGTLENFDIPFTSTSGWVNGRRGGALSFAGGTSNDSVNLGNLSVINGAERVTVSAWVYDRSGSASKSVLSRFSGSPNDPSFLFYTSDPGNGGGNSMSFSPDGQEVIYTTGSVHQTNRWEHWVAVFDGTQGADLDRVTLYLNGVVQAEDITSTPFPTAIDSSPENVRIGADADLAAEFNGVIDEMRLYNRALSSSEVVSLYGSGAARFLTGSKNLDNGSTLQNGLVGHWTFDGADFTNFVADGSGNANHGFLFNTATSTMRTNGVLGQAISLDNVDDYVSVADSAPLDITGTLSMSAWIKKNSLTNDDVLFGKGDNYTLETTGDELGFYFVNVGTQFQVTTNANLVTGEWYHVAVTYNDATNQIIFYVNGVEKNDTTAFGDPENVSINPDNNKLQFSSISENADAYIDDARVYNRVLTATEIKQLYNLGRAVITP